MQHHTKRCARCLRGYYVNRPDYQWVCARGSSSATFVCSDTMGGGHLSGSLCLLSCSLDVSHTNRLNKRPLCAHTHSRVSYPSHTSAIIIMMKCAQNCKRLIVRRIMRVGYLNECVCACLCACLYVLMCTMLGRDA